MRVWLITEAYYPDEAGTAYTFTALAEYLAKYYEVNVLCGFPRYSARGLSLPKKENRNGVNIIRCMGTTFNKDILFLRFVNLLTISMSIFFNSILKFRRDDIALVVTSPPSLPFTMALVCFIRKVKCILRVDDAFPENLDATNLIKKGSVVFDILAKLTKILYNNVAKIVVLGRDQKALVASYLKSSNTKKIDIITNWADIEDIRPSAKINNALLRDLNLKEKFIVQIAGNMGQGQAIESVFKCAAILKCNSNIHFLCIGSGSKIKWMQNEILDKKLDNITLLEQRPRTDQNNFLNACDISIITLLSTMTGIGVPSRIYNVMAAGKPIIGVVPSDSELAMILGEEKVGWVVSPDEPETLSKTILEAYLNPDLLKQMGYNSRKVAESKYSSAHVLNKYRELIGPCRVIAD